jgi:hypothetical protein
MLLRLRVRRLASAYGRGKNLRETHGGDSIKNELEMRSGDWRGASDNALRVGTETEGS